MKLIFLSATISFALFCSPVVNAQSVPPQYKDTLTKLKSATPEQRAKLQSDLMRDKLSLTAIQYKQISDLNLEYARKMEPILRSDDSRFSKYRKAKPLMEEKEGKLKGLLTAEQFKKYENVKKELMEQARKAAGS